MKMVWGVLPKGQKPTTEQWEFSAGAMCLPAGIEAEFAVRDAGVVRNLFLKTLANKAQECGARLDDLKVWQLGALKEPVPHELREYRLGIMDPVVPMEQRERVVDCDFTSAHNEGKFYLSLFCRVRAEVDMFTVDIEPTMFDCRPDRPWPDLSWARDLVYHLLTSFAREIGSDFTLLGEDNIPVLKYDYRTDTLFLAIDNDEVAA